MEKREKNNKIELKKEFIIKEFTSKFGRESILLGEDEVINININQLGFIPICDNFIKEHFEYDYTSLIEDMAEYYCKIVCENNPEPIIDLLNKSYKSKNIKFELNEEYIKIIDINGIDWNISPKNELDIILSGHLNIKGMELKQSLDIKGMFNLLEEIDNHYFIKLPNVNNRLKNTFKYLTDNGVKENYGVFSLLYEVLPIIERALEDYRNYADKELIEMFENDIDKIICRCVDVEQYGILKNRIVIFDEYDSMGGVEFDDFDYMAGVNHLIVQIVTEFMNRLLCYYDGKVRILQALSMLSITFIKNKLQEKSIQFVPIDNQDIIQIKEALKRLDLNRMGLFESYIFDEILNYFEVSSMLENCLQDTKEDVKEEHKIVFDKIIAKCK